MRNLILCLMALAFVACDNNETEAYTGSSTYAFKQSEIVVNASETDSFRLEVYYIEEPETDLARNLFSFHVDEERSTPDWKEYFETAPYTVQMEEAEDCTFFSYINIKADKLKEDNKEVVVYLNTFGSRDSSLTGFDGKEPIYDIVIRLLPTSPVID